MLTLEHACRCQTCQCSGSSSTCYSLTPSRLPSRPFCCGFPSPSQPLLYGLCFPISLWAWLGNLAGQQLCTLFQCCTPMSCILNRLLHSLTIAQPRIRSHNVLVMVPKHKFSGHNWCLLVRSVLLQRWWCACVSKDGLSANQPTSQVGQVCVVRGHINTHARRHCMCATVPPTLMLL